MKRDSFPIIIDKALY